MAKLLTEQVGETPIQILLGSLHTLKKVEWRVSVGKPSVAEHLTGQGITVHSLPQHWQQDRCSSGGRIVSRFMNIDEPEALQILNESLMALINAKPHTSTKDVIDGIILWECDASTPSNKPDSEALSAKGT